MRMRAGGPVIGNVRAVAAGDDFVSRVGPGGGRGGVQVRRRRNEGDVDTRRHEKCQKWGAQAVAREPAVPRWYRNYGILRIFGT